MKKENFFDTTRPMIQALRKVLPEAGFEKMSRIKFKNGLFANEELVIVDGAITTQQRYEQWEASLAHVKHGQVWRLGKIIASADDIEFLDIKGK